MLAAADPHALRRSLVELGTATTLRPLFDRLDRGEPVSVGLLGASVGQSGGCIAQPYKRCMLYGPGRAAPAPSRNTGPGFLVQLFDAINRTWPHPGHALHNAAADGTPGNAILPCLFSHLPHELHLVVLEFGSMARYTQRDGIEAVLRVLLALPSRPVLVFLTFREFCVASKVAYRRDLFALDKPTPHSKAERFFGELCRQYNQSCLSYFEAVRPGLYGNRSGFALDDIATDCLHPDQGRYGNAYVSDILRHWLQRAARRARAGAPRAAAARGGWALPPPLPRHADQVRRRCRAPLISAGSGLISCDLRRAAPDLTRRKWERWGCG